MRQRGEAPVFRGTTRPERGSWALISRVGQSRVDPRRYKELQSPPSLYYYYYSYDAFRRNLTHFYSCWCIRDVMHTEYGVHVF